MTSNNDTFSRQTPWAGNSAKTVTSNGKQFTVTREKLTAVARHLSITWLFFHRFDPFALLCNKSLNDWSWGEQWILFPSNLNVSLDFVSGNIEILGKQNSLFPSGPVIKCLMSNWAVNHQFNYIGINFAITKLQKLVTVAYIDLATATCTYQVAM